MLHKHITTNFNNLTLEGRVIVPYMGYDKHMDLIQRGAQIGAAKLWYDKPKKQFSLLVSLEIVCFDNFMRPLLCLSSWSSG
jgi:hypothetical protein